MSDRKREVARADKVLPGLWRIRLPITPWPGVPHVNAYAIAAGSGVVLIDTGLAEPGGLGQLERGLALAGLKLEHVRLLVCTHAHSDHYGLAGPIVDAAGCELWMHPAHEHMTSSAEDPDGMLARRLEVARQSGVPVEALKEYEARRKGVPLGIERIVPPDRDLVPGVEVETDLGTFQVYETPGHAPSHVCLHQPDNGLLISGDHLLGRVSLYYDFGYTPDPAGEFLSQPRHRREARHQPVRVRPRPPVPRHPGPHRRQPEDGGGAGRAGAGTGLRMARPRPRSSWCRTCSAWHPRT